MRKREADNVPRVEIKELRKAGFFSGKESGGLLWMSPYTGDIVRFCISNVFIDTMRNALPSDTKAQPTESFEGMIEFKSVMGIFQDAKTGGWLQSEGPPIWQSASLSTTPCNYGKSRFWFHCPGLKGKHCRERVGVLYWLDERLACRKCHNLTYKVRNVLKSARHKGRLTPIGELDRMWDDVTKYSYRGKPTKRFLRAQKKQSEFSQAFEPIQTMVEEIHRASS